MRAIVTTPFPIDLTHIPANPRSVKEIPGDRPQDYDGIALCHPDSFQLDDGREIQI